MLVENHGLVRLIARTSGKQAVKHKAQLQPFQPLLIQMKGRGELKYLATFELVNNAPMLTGLNGEKLYCGFYLNELSARIIPQNEPLDGVFALYQNQLTQLVTSDNLEGCLRTFELQLLQQLGYGVDFTTDSQGSAVQGQYHYYYIPEQGWQLQAHASPSSFYGEHLLAIAQYDFSTPAVQRVAKHFCRYLLKPLLGAKPLKSKELFTANTAANHL